MTKLIIVITYLHLPVQIQEIDIWAGYNQCRIVGKVIIADAMKSELVTNANFVCTE